MSWKTVNKWNFTNKNGEILNVNDKKKIINQFCNSANVNVHQIVRH